MKCHEKIDSNERCNYDEDVRMDGECLEENLE